MTLDEEFERFIAEHSGCSNYAVWKAAWKAAQAQFKPSWDDAPTWANYLAQDENGKWTWFEKIPHPYTNGFWANNTAKWEYAGQYKTDWKQTLEKRT